MSATDRSIKLRLDAETTQYNQKIDKAATVTERLAAQAELAAREVDVASARMKRAALDVESAEKALEEARSKNDASSREVIDAENNLAEARLAAARSTDNLTKAQDALNNSIGESEKYAKIQQSSLQRANAFFQANRQDIDKVGDSLTKMGTTGVVTLSAATMAAMSWESAWAGVTKTVDGSAVVMGQLQQDLRDMAKFEVPASHEEIAAVAEAAGQLGIQTKNIKSFTRTMIDLGETTNMTAETAATGLAQFSNIMQSSQTDVDRMGSTIVDLGNNFATTESDVLALSMRLAGAGNQAGLTEADVMGISAAMSSVGIEAEAGGTAMSMTMKRIGREVEMSGDNLGTFASIAGMTSDEFKTAWGQNAAGALDQFVTGLSQTERMGMSTNQVLAMLGITGIREADALLRLSGAQGLMTDALETANNAYQENTALAAEAGQRYETVESQVKMAWNAVKDGAIEVGQYVLPVVADLAGRVSSLAQWFSELPAPVKGAVTAIGGIASVGALAAGTTIKLAGSISDSVLAAVRLKAEMPRAAKGLGIATKGALGLAAALNAVAMAGTDGTGKAKQGTEEIRAGIQQLARDVEEAAGSTDQNMARAFASTRIFKEEAHHSLKDLVDDLADPGFWDGVGHGIENATANAGNIFGADWRNDLMKSRAELQGYLSEMASMASEDLPTVALAFQAMNDEIGGTDESAAKLLAVSPDLRDALIGVANDAGLAVDDATLLDLALGRVSIAADEAGDAASGATGGVGDLADGFGDVGAEADAALEAILGFANGVLGLRDANRKWESSLDDARAAVKQAKEDFTDAERARGDALDITTEAGRKNQAVLDDLVSAGLNQIEHARESGASQAELAAMLEETRKQVIKTARGFGESKTDAEAFADSVRLIPEFAEVIVKVEADQALTQLSAVDKEVRNLPNGKTVTITTNRVTNEKTYRMAPNAQEFKAKGGRAGIPALAGGGRLPRTGLGTDQILGIGRDGIPTAWVDDLEWIINNRSSDKYNSILGMINRDDPRVQHLANLPALAKGGRIATKRGEVQAAKADVETWKDYLREAKSKVKSAQNAYDAIDGKKENRARKQAAKKELNAAKAEVKRVEKSLKKARDYVSTVRKELSELRSARTDMTSDAGQKTFTYDERTGRVVTSNALINQGTSGLDGAYGLVEQAKSMAQLDGLSTKESKKLDKAANSARKNFEKLYKEAALLEGKLAKAEGHVSEMASIKASVGSALAGGFSLGNSIKEAVEATTETVQKSNGRGAIWHETITKPGTARTVSGAGMLSDAKAYQSKLSKFSNALKRLADWGASSTLLQEIAGYGVEDGLLIANSLTQAQVKELTGVYAQIDRLSQSAGQHATRNFTAEDGTVYAGGLSEGNQVVKGLEKQAKDLAKATENQTKSLVNAMGKPFNLTYKNGQLTSIAQKKWRGGKIYGGGTGTSDSVSLRASTGEYLVNAKSTAANEGLVEAINHARGPVDLSRLVPAGSTGARAGVTNVSVTVPDIYVQNPFTGEYMKTQMSSVARNEIKVAVSAAGRGY